jgi:antitoxin VapB
MAVNLKNPETERLLRALAARADESLTQAAATAIRERLERLEAADRQKHAKTLVSLDDLIAEARRGAVIDDRPLKVIADELWSDE